MAFAEPPRSNARGGVKSGVRTARSKRRASYLPCNYKGDRRDSNPRPSEPQSTDTCSQVSLLFRVFRFLSPLEGADERTRTADLISLRVCGQALQGCAGGCKCRIFRGVSFLRLAECCTVLRSRWYKSGINITLIFASYRLSPAYRPALA
jgi:hypothetical protein